MTTQAPQGTLTIELQVTISEADTFDNFLDIAMQSAFNWFSNAMNDVTDIMPNNPSLPDWDVLSITRLDDSRRLSEGRRLAEAEYAIILETKYVVSESTINTTDLAQKVYREYIPAVNSKVSSSSWTLESLSYAFIQDDYSGLSASVGSIPKWSSHSNATTTEDDTETSCSVLATASAALPAAAAAALAAVRFC